ncbi:hypothetical protein JS530_08095 [Bifidobacterium sp. LC6]|uniref:Secreted protein n=1 Tax=Bifidobacterium colobi TaxID=2809026 RepID=A0ABS5UWG8_9BIFI|nr:hypothetical protein [Bifidobacterium colobi]MBT1175454.1 hypothetical protein [Bifidobacterium colobi]
MSTTFVWVITIVGLVLCVGCAVAGVIAALRKPKDGSSAAPVATAYIAGTFGEKAISWTDAKARAIAEGCGAAYTSFLKGASSSVTTNQRFGGQVTVTGGPDGLEDVVAPMQVPVPRDAEPFNRAYDRSIRMLMDRTLYGHHVRIYLLDYNENFDGSRYDAVKHENLTALVIALDEGLPSMVESALTRAVADSCPSMGGIVPVAGNHVRFLTVLQPDSSGVQNMYEAVASLA